LGRAIIRRATREKWDARFTVYSRDEEKQFKLRQRYPDVRCVLGDVLNLDRLMLAMQGFDTVIHASAVKFVPEAEFNVFETVDVNVRGSQNVAFAAHAARVGTVVGISTDKACLPVNLYGATKMVMERTFGEANKWGETRFVVTRYGNVVGSTGSIIPVFQQQLAATGKVKVTNPAMTRFWLAPDDAVDLVVECVAHRDDCGGDIIVPLPGAMQIGGLASVISPNIEIIGARPGEKIHESLVSEHEASRTQYLGQHLVIRSTGTVLNTKCGHAPYSSDAPTHWIRPDEMLAIIEDAVLV
jgi:UDP-N-acetylglucosamine 4,6-dehydratase